MRARAYHCHEVVMSRERERARPHHRATWAITVQVVALLRRPHCREVGEDEGGRA
jgi:hypothetical protein